MNLYGFYHDTRRNCSIPLTKDLIEAENLYARANSGKLPIDRTLCFSARFQGREAPRFRVLIMFMSRPIIDMSDLTPIPENLLVHFTFRHELRDAMDGASYFQFLEHEVPRPDFYEFVTNKPFLIATHDQATERILEKPLPPALNSEAIRRSYYMMDEQTSLIHADQRKTVMTFSGPSPNPSVFAHGTHGLFH